MTQSRTLHGGHHQVISEQKQMTLFFTFSENGFFSVHYYPFLQGTQTQNCQLLHDALKLLHLLYTPTGTESGVSRLTILFENKISWYLYSMNSE